MTDMVLGTEGIQIAGRCRVSLQGHVIFWKHWCTHSHYTGRQDLSTNGAQTKERAGIYDLGDQRRSHSPRKTTHSSP